MDFLILISLFVTGYLVWGIAARTIALDEYSRLGKSIVYLSCAFIAANIQRKLLNGDSDVGVLFGWFLFGSVILISLYIGKGSAKQDPGVSIPFKLSPIAEAAYSTASQDDDPLAKWRSASPSSAAFIADIEFDYRDAKGQDSHRRVHVDAVDDFYFQGFCLKAADVRTFVIDRVKGKVLDCDTGELLSAKSWAKAARQHPDNDPEKIEIGRDSYWDETPPADAPEHAEIEICFTGFVKADKLRLEGMAELADMKVRQSVTKGLTHLCTGPNAGPAKISQAMEVGAELIDQSEFFELADRP